MRLDVGKITLLDARHGIVPGTSGSPILTVDGLAVGLVSVSRARGAGVSHEQWGQPTLLRALPAGAHVGSASLRRQAQLRRVRPDIRVSLLRGNVGTRIRKVESGEYDATLLALAGLRRLGLTDPIAEVLDIDEFLPAVGQGAIAVAIRAGDSRVAQALEGILDAAPAARPSPAMRASTAAGWSCAGSSCGPTGPRPWRSP